MYLGSSDLAIWVHKGGISLLEVTSMAMLNLKLKLPVSYFGFLSLVNQWAKKDAILLAIVNNSGYPGEIELLPKIGLMLSMYAMEMIAGGILSTSLTSYKRQWKTTNTFRQDCQWTWVFRKESWITLIDKKLLWSKCLLRAKVIWNAQSLNIVIHHIYEQVIHCRTEDHDSYKYFLPFWHQSICKYIE